eukprot:CAMPEP_0179122982 /NCGR_PEP_ID=MMETSP0796-20121207/58063_1 /TAXON_ID=73915 /ORGANISM="Pyrodinium bahamense, Strain pbaha01" /LENGTH=273 /DNA_ID=CAMNT_0020821615 /DNA_START=129 /DNA_END=950 /DNA_ORIENTATION=+
MPSRICKEVDLPQGCNRPALKAHYVLHEPDWSVVSAPVPALLFLHGALTYIWPESLGPEVQDRFEKLIPYVDRFDTDLTWACFLAACHSLGPGRVDFSRLCVTGFSMGAQAVWDIAIHHGSHLAAAVPMAGSCKWAPGMWRKEDELFAQVQDLPLWAFSSQDDKDSYEWGDFHWLAKRRGIARRPLIESKLINTTPSIKQVDHTWGDLATLTLFCGKDMWHNCWDLVYRTEDTFGLFQWMASNSIRPKPDGDTQRQGSEAHRFRHTSLAARSW